MASRKKNIERLMQSVSVVRRSMMVGFSATKKAIIPPSQACVLRYIACHDQANIKALAEYLHISSSAVTQLIDSLVKKGYVVRTSHVDDRRVVFIRFAPKAQTLFEEFKAHGIQNMTDLFEVFTDEELEQYAYLNAKIVEGITRKKDRALKK